jgi:hypothetical protein
MRDGRTVATLSGEGLNTDAMLGAMAHGADIPSNAGLQEIDQ